MPSLDVTDILLDPDFCEELVVQRRAETINGKGRAQKAVTVIDPAPFGVVLPQNDVPMQRGPDQQNLPRLLQVHTPFRLRGPAPGFQPDIIIWNGDPFVVNKVHDFSRFGQGFIQADCSSMSTIDQAPV